MKPNNEKTNFYKIKLSENLMQQLKYFANQWGEDPGLCFRRTLKAGALACQKIKCSEPLASCLQRILKLGLIVRQTTKWKHIDELCKTLDGGGEK